MVVADSRQQTNQQPAVQCALLAPLLPIITTWRLADTSLVHCVACWPACVLRGTLCCCCVLLLVPAAPSRHHMLTLSVCLSVCLFILLPSADLQT
jgi:hypothetical protein